MGPMFVRLCRNSVEYNILLTENGFDQIGRSREPLAELTMANRDAQRVCKRLVANIAAQASTLMSARYLHHQLLSSNRSAARTA